VEALLEAYYNTNIRSTLGSFTVKLPSAKRHGKFVCPVRLPLSHYHWPGCVSL
jgi:hypothetical protein